MSPFYTRCNRRGGTCPGVFFTSPLKFRWAITHRVSLTPRGWALEKFSTRQEGGCSAQKILDRPRHQADAVHRQAPRSPLGIFQRTTTTHRVSLTPRGWVPGNFSTRQEGWCSANFFLDQPRGVKPTRLVWRGGCSKNKLIKFLATKLPFKFRIKRALPASQRLEK